MDENVDKGRSMVVRYLLGETTCFDPWNNIGRCTNYIEFKGLPWERKVRIELYAYIGNDTYVVQLSDNSLIRMKRSDMQNIW